MGNIFNRLLRKAAKAILRMPKIREGFEEVCQYYAIRRVEGGLDTFKREFELQAIIGSQKLAPREGAFNESDAAALAKVVQMVLRRDIMVAEIGSWTGMSTAVLGKSVADYQGRVFAIDHWLGSEGSALSDFAKGHDVYSIFRRNMLVLGLRDVVHPLVMDSQTASQIFADGILDLVFIDADHRYEYIKKDISLWLPKLKGGGILCGHDCEGYYSQYGDEDKKRVEENLKDDCISTVDDHTPPVDLFTHHICHPGVVKALHEDLQERYSIMPNSVVWYYIKH
jgi:predicted O-methyltransferase YrrM